MKARLGIYEKKPYLKQSVEGLNDMAIRFQTMGGYRQQERMIHDKRCSFDRAVHFSYQAAEISKVGEENPLRIRALINANQVNPDYDNKVLSVGYEHNFKTGDVFEWLGTKTYWLIYLQDLTELAYFKGDIRKCNYQIKWKNENNEIESVWVVLKGPTETKIDSVQKDGNFIDIPNRSLQILMPKNESTLKYFQRYSKFYITGADSVTADVCWRVEAVDTLSMPNIIEISAIEYYSNIFEDDVEGGVVGNLIVDPIIPDTSNDLIIGESSIKPKSFYKFTYVGDNIAEWHIDSKYPIKYKINEKEITLKWDQTYSGQFELRYGDLSKTIIVESIF